PFLRHRSAVGPDSGHTATSPSTTRVADNASRPDDDCPRMLFALKLTLVPIFVAGVTLGSRRWGPRIGGWPNAVPMVAGPALLFLAVEQGTAFAAHAALNTLAGLIGVAAFCLAYGWTAPRVPWWGALTTGWAAFAVITFILHDVPWRPWS